MTCVYVNGMNDETIIPDEAIQLSPSGAPDDIRPGNTWVTNGPNDRYVEITVGDTLKSGGTIQLVDNENVDKYTVETITPTGLVFVKVNISLIILLTSEINITYLLFDIIYIFF